MLACLYANHILPLYVEGYQP